MTEEAIDDYEERYVAFVDLLGFKAQVTAAEKNPSKRAALSEILGVVKDTLGENQYIGFRRNFFSCPKSDGGVAGAPNHRSVSMDNDRAFGVAFKARVRAMGIRDRPISFRSPWQNCFAERLIGSIRRECTDHLIVFNAEHLRRILAKYSTYYNEVRTHIALGKDAPYTRPIERFGDIVAHPILGGGLHHRYVRI